MKTARGLIVWLLLPVAIAGALVVSASATITLLTSQGVSAEVAPFGVLMLEVASLAGTLLWVLVGNTSLRRDARLTTMAATAVAVVAGVFAYGPVGAVGGIMLVAVVHLASRAWRETWAGESAASAAVETPEQEPRTVAEAVAERDPAPAPEPVVDEPAQSDAPLEVQAELDEPSADVVDIHTFPPAPRTWRHGKPRWNRAVYDARSGKGRTLLKRHHKLTDQEAKNVLAAAKGKAA